MYVISSINNVTEIMQCVYISPIKINWSKYDKSCLQAKSDNQTKCSSFEICIYIFVQKCFNNVVSFQQKTTFKSNGRLTGLTVNGWRLTGVINVWNNFGMRVFRVCQIVIVEEETILVEKCLRYFVNVS